MPQPATLKGTHTSLEPLTFDHVDGLLAAASESRDTFGYTKVPETLPDVHAYVSGLLQEQDRGVTVPFATVSAGRVVGGTRFCDIEHWADGTTVLEIGGTWLAPSVQRTPVNTEAKLLMLSHAFDEWGALRVKFQTDSRNKRSWAAIERIGARLDGVVRAHKQAADGTVRDSAFFSILREEWPEARRKLEARLAQTP